MKTIFLVFLTFVFFATTGFAQDPNFYIYICFGQSNMEGQGAIMPQDKTVNSRFKVLQAVNCSNLSRTKDVWYTAVPPTCRCYTNLSPADYFGRTMVANLPDSITVGIINVSVGGCDIRLFDKDIYQDYDSTYTEAWFQNIIAEYEKNPYQYLINLAKRAQQDGVIKGILLHQGETNTGNSQWPSYVKKIYNDMLNDLSLNADSVPLLAGELLYVNQGGCCGSMNTIINRLPDTIPTAHVISAEGCSGADVAHFSSDGYRKLGRRYAVKMLSLMGYEAVYAEAECGTVGESFLIKSDSKASNNGYITTVTGLNNLLIPPSDDSLLIKINFTVNADTTYYIYGRFNNPADSNDSYWIKIDNEDFELIDNLTTTGWQWLEIGSYNLAAGEHTIQVGTRENRTSIDKLVIKNSQIPPADVGEEAFNICIPAFSPVGINTINSLQGCSLEQNYPNPFSRTTSISFQIPYPTFVSLKVYNIFGTELTELAGKVFNAGRNTIKFDLEKLPAGLYYYTIKTDNFTASRKMIITD
jgi:hypothetical protein